MRGMTREAIISASLELFAKHGYSATTTEAIAKKAHISKGLIFTHFSTKQDLLFAILDEQIEHIIQRQRSAACQRTVHCACQLLASSDKK